MRKPIIAGNWKMNKTPAEAAALVTELLPLVKDATCDVVVCTPSVCFSAVAPIIAGTKPPAQKVYHTKSFSQEKPISKVYPVIDNDLARDNVENDMTAADLQDL